MCIKTEANLQRAVDRPVLRAEVFFSAVILILVFLMAARAPVDTDLWWHLRAGESTLTNGQVTLVDTFSYTRAGEHWTNHSWLAQVMMFSIYRWGGFAGLSAMIALAAAISIGFLLPAMEGPVILKGFILVLVSTVASMVWSARPQIFSLVCLAVVGYLLYLYKWRGKNVLWNLVPLFILWSNLHAGYTLGLILIGTMLIGEVANHVFGIRGGEILSWKHIKTLLFWGILSGIAVLANPNGIKTWLVPFQTIGVQALQQLVSEWASPDFHQISQLTFLVLFFITLAAIFYSGKRLDGSDAAGLLIFATLALVARRNFGPFALICAPVLARHLWPALQRGWERIPALQLRIQSWTMRSGMLKKDPWPAKTNSALNLVVLVLLSLAAVGKCYLVNTPQLSTEYEAKFFPKGALTYLEAHHPPGRLFNSYDWGGYLLWNARDYPVFVDGRTDLYNDEIIGQWLGVVNAKTNWQATLDRWDVHLVLLEPDWPVVPILAEHGWKILYSDSMSILYGR